MHTPVMRSRHAATALLAPALVAVLTLAGCSGGDTSKDPSAGSGSSSASGSDTPSSSGSATVKPYLPVPDGVELTDQGSTLKVGDHAVVAYEPRQKQVGVLDIKVTGLEKTTFAKSFQGWQLDKATLSTTPYFVHASVKNVGRTDLGGRSVPLYIVDGHNTLIEASSFASTFKPCPSQPFPAKFKHGDRVKSCLVYLSPKHGDLTAVSFRPTQDFNPITWTGKLTTVGAEPTKKGAKGDQSPKAKKSSKG